MGSVRRRQLMGGKPKPKDIVNVYNNTITITENDGKPSVAILWFNFRLNAEYEVEAVYNNYRGPNWNLPPQGGHKVTSGSTGSYGKSVKYTCYFTSLPNPSRFMGYIAKAYGGTVTVKITETIHPN